MKLLIYGSNHWEARYYLSNKNRINWANEWKWRPRPPAGDAPPVQRVEFVTGAPGVTAGDSNQRPPIGPLVFHLSDANRGKKWAIFPNWIVGHYLCAFDLSIQVPLVGPEVNAFRFNEINGRRSVGKGQTKMAEFVVSGLPAAKSSPSSSLWPSTRWKIYPVCVCVYERKKRKLMKNYRKYLAVQFHFCNLFLSVF